jgi:hypothetical protein
VPVEALNSPRQHPFRKEPTRDERRVTLGVVIVERGRR